MKINTLVQKVFTNFFKGLGIYVLLFNFGLKSNAQTQKSWQWVNHIGGKAWDLTAGLASDQKNQIYLLGNFSDTLISDKKKTASAGGQDIFLARYNEKGNLNDFWRYGGKGFDQANCFGVTGKGNILIGGSVYNNFAEDTPSENNAVNKLFISYLSNKGNVLWQSFLLPENEASLFLLSINNNGDVFVAGLFTGNLTVEDTVLTSNGKRDIFLAQYKEDGSLTKIISFGGAGDDNPTALEASDNKVYISGSYEKAFSLDTISLSSTHGSSNGFIFGFSDDLKPAWKIQIEGQQYVHIASLQTDSEGNLFAAGSFDMDLICGQTTLESKGHTDGFITKINPNGNYIWVKGFGTSQYEYAYNLIQDNLNGMILTGMLGDTLFLDNQSIFPVSENSALALQYDSSGSVIWGDCISGDGSNFGNASVLDRKGNLYLAGSFSGKLNKEMLSIPSFGDQDIFVAKYYNCPDFQNEILGNDFICPGSYIELYVKPEFTKVIWNDTIRDVYSIQVSKPGMYSVTMYDKHGCLVNDTIEIKPAPLNDFNLGKDVCLPVENTLTLIGPENYSNYLWQDQSTESTLIAQAENDNPGNYIFWLNATDSLGCQAMDTIVIDFYQKLGWIDITKVNLTCYPNPVQEWLTWSVNVNESCTFNLEIRDANGKSIYNEHIGNYEPGSEMKLSFEQFPAGVYYLQIKDGAGNGSKTVCVIKQ